MTPDYVVQELAAHYESRISYLQAICRIAADRLRDGGTFPIKGETWALLDYAAGESKPAEISRTDGKAP